MDQTQIRNFSIIAHIDHGKTTLTDRLLHQTGTISVRDVRERIMDSNPIEQERGITIKLAPVRMYYSVNGQEYMLNLIDTPGHVDFGYEVSRSLAACEGALLVVDATQGVQAQTLSNYEKARALGLKIIPVLNKIDLPNSDVEAATLDLMEMCQVEEDEIISVSAKTGQNIELLLQTIIDTVPAPQGDAQKPLRALIFSSQYSQHKGVISYVRVVDGVLTKEAMVAMATKVGFTPVEIGIFNPEMSPVTQLQNGQVGYIASGMKEVGALRVGDTLTLRGKNDEVQALPGYLEPMPMVYMDFYPIDGDDFMALQDAMAKLAMHDAALQYTPTHSLALGNGLRVGFLGILHNEIVRERLEREFNLELIATSPSVPYKILLKNEKTPREVHTAAEFPDPSLIAEIHEPMTSCTILTPKEYYGAVVQLCEDFRGKLESVTDLGNRVKIAYTIPLAELIVSMHDMLKSASSGFASLEYELVGFEAVDAVKLDIMIQHEPIEALSQVVVKERVEMVGKRLVKKLKEVVPRQQFEIPIQAAVGGKIIARETIKAYRKDVTAKLYGGDITRRKKLLEKQKKGKKRMKEIGRVSLNQEAFMAVLER